MINYKDFQELFEDAASKNKKIYQMSEQREADITEISVKEVRE